MFRVPKDSLYLAGWDDVHPTGAGPIVVSHHVADLEGRGFLNEPPFLRFEGAEAVSGEASSFDDELAGNPDGSFIDYRRHLIPAIEHGVLIILPRTDELPPAILRSLGVPWHDVRRLKPADDMRIAYAGRPEAVVIQTKLIAYFYLLGWSLMIDGRRMAGENGLCRAAGAQSWIQTMLTTSFLVRRHEKRAFDPAEKHFLQLAARQLDAEAGLPDVRTAADKLVQAETDCAANRATAEEIAVTVADCHARGGLLVPKHVTLEEACRPLRDALR